ncbi:MAG TPA: AbiEi antitoxin N-terminal domain-containing protein, partial [Candidatus Babeliaceae bacterium]|nr:AbiEi antitoxin N-terminal domain-containing protein [Candidatus Babeliaceae bacterium]
MSAAIETKINHLLKSIPSGTVVISSWLAENGYSYELQRRYRNSGWFESIGSGAMKRSGEKISYEGALYALQTQADSRIHPGGRTALSMLGKAHYLDLNIRKAVLFGYDDELLPAWFKNYKWGVEINYHATSFLP